MELNKNMMQKTVLALVLLAVAALSAFVVSERVSRTIRERITEHGIK